MDKEYYSVLNDPRHMPYRGQRVLLFRESTYWYEVETIVCNTHNHAEWYDFCDRYKILYWVYIDKIENLIPRKVGPHGKNEWYTPNLPLWEGESYAKMNEGVKKPRARSIEKDFKICHACSACVKNEHGTMVGCLVMNKRLPAFNSLQQRRGFMRLAKELIKFPTCFTLTKPSRQHITEPLPKRTTDKRDEDLDFSEAAMEEEYGG